MYEVFRETTFPGKNNAVIGTKLELPDEDLTFVFDLQDPGEHQYPHVDTSSPIPRPGCVGEYERG